MMNETVILTGSVKSPSNSNMATQIAKNFVSVDLKSTSSQQASSGVEVKSVSHEPNEKVINMLAVEGEEQVMLRVTVAEVQRSLSNSLVSTWAAHSASATCRWRRSRRMRCH